MANPFSIEPANPLQALMTGVQGYDRGVKAAKEGEIAAGRQEAMTALQSGGDLRNPLAKLLGVGDIQGATVIAKLAEAQGQNSGYYGTPIYGTDAQGNAVIGTFNKAGQFKKIDTPGITVTPGIKTIDTGTGTLIVGSRSGQPVGGQAAQPGSAAPGVRPAVPGATPGFVPKDIEGKEAAEKRGAATGQAQVDLPNVLSKASQSIRLIDDMIKHPGRGTATGLSGVLHPSNYIPGTSAKDFIVRQKQLQGRTFLEAFESLKGGGQITEVEGTKAEQAIARLDRSQSDEEYVAALKELRGILVEGMKRASAKAHGVRAPGQPQRPAVTQPPAAVGGVAPPSAAVSALKADPRLSEQFDAKYGVGAAARVLGVLSGD